LPPLLPHWPAASTAGSARLDFSVSFHLLLKTP
jgi:hypothetical protein